MEMVSITARFGQSGRKWSGVHTGVDFDGSTGDAIRSISSGTVSSAGWDGPYGYKTVITTDDGTEFWYCHQSRIQTSVGSRVSPGQVIGFVGSTGNVTGSHLHLETRPDGGAPVDPMALLAANGLG
jgi:murein DD-endopeptidase MepM/ murein hydrolase activator NlpD